MAGLSGGGGEIRAAQGILRCGGFLIEVRIRPIRVSQTIPSLCREPEFIAAGDNRTWTRAVNNYSSEFWSLFYLIRNKDQSYRFNAVANAGNFTVTLNSNVTANWASGEYAIGAYVQATNDASQQVEVRCAFPTLTVGENLAGKPNGIDPRSFAARMLPLIEETIGKLTMRTVSSATVNGQAYTINDLSKLWQMREKFRSEVRREQAQKRLDAGLGAGNKIGVRFRPLNSVGWPNNGGYGQYGQGGQ